MIASGVAGIMVAAALFFVADVLEGPFFSFSTKTWPAEVRGGKVVGGIQGPVKEADSETGTVRIASGFLGFGSKDSIITLERLQLKDGDIVTELTEDQLSQQPEWTKK